MVRRGGVTVRKRRFGLMSRLAILIFVVYAAMTLLNLQAKLNEGRAQNDEFEHQVAIKKTVNQKALSEAAVFELSDEDIKRIAREKFGFVEPGEIVFIDISR